MNQNLVEIIKAVLTITLPIIKNLIESNVVPTLKRKGYEALDKKADKIIEDLAQNAAKIAKEENEIKKLAYIEGSQLGVDMLKKLAEKLNKAATEIEKVL